MPDNVSLPVAGTGTTGPVPVATEDIGGVQYQRVKLVDGTAASAAAIPGNATDGLLVNLGANNDVVVTGTVTANVSLSAGAATEAAQTTGNNSLTSIAAATTLEDTPHTSGDRGVCVLGVRQDADTSPVSASGDYHTPIFDAAGNLKVHIKAGAGSGGTALQDNAPFTPGTTNFTPIGGEVDDTLTTATAEGQAGAARITPQRALHVNLRDSAGVELAVGGATQYVEGLPHAAGNQMTMAGAVRRNIAAAGVDDGDVATLNVDAIGRVWVRQGGLATDQDGFTAGLTQVQSVGGAVFTGTPAAQVDGLICAPALTARRGWHVNLRTSAGVEVTRAAGASAAVGDPALGVVLTRQDTLVTDGSASGEYVRAKADAFGRLHTTTVTPAVAFGGATPSKLVSAATTNATSVKASAGTLYMLTASNVNAAARYLKLYNKASAPTVGTDVPVFTFIIPGNTAGAGTNIPLPACGINFSLGLAFALTTEATDAGTTGVAANEVVVNLAYL